MVRSGRWRWGWRTVWGWGGRGVGLRGVRNVWSWRWRIAMYLHFMMETYAISSELNSSTKETCIRMARVEDSVVRCHSPLFRQPGK